MKKHSVKGLNQLFNIEGPDYIFLDDRQNDNNVAPPRKVSYVGRGNFQILKIVSKSDEKVLYEKQKIKKNNNIQEEFIDTYLEIHKDFISSKPFYRCKLKRNVYQYYDTLNINYPNKVSQIDWKI